MKKQIAVYYDKDFIFSADKIVIDLTNREHLNKPMKAFWTSSVIAEDSFLSSEWIDFCINDFYADEETRPIKYLFAPKKDLKVYELDNIEDYLSPKLIKSTTSQFGFSVCRNVLIDYKAMQEAGWDGIHFTSNGARLGHSWYDKSVPDEVRDALYCIDVESTVWFRPDWYESVIEEDSWFDYTWFSVRDKESIKTKWYENYDESDCGHLLLA